MMLKLISLLLLVLALFFSIFSCEGDKKVPTEVVQTCGTCHLVPSPKSLPEAIWEESIFPKMSEYFRWGKPSNYAYANGNLFSKKGFTPMDDKRWEKVLSYFKDSALVPEERLPREDFTLQKDFNEILLSNATDGKGVTAISSDGKGKIYAATQGGILSWQIQDTLISYYSGEHIITYLDFQEVDSLYFLFTEVLGPLDAPLGGSATLDIRENKVNIHHKGMFRPVNALKVQEKNMVAEFGNEKGGLALWENEIKEYISEVPGILKSSLYRDSNEVVFAQAQAIEGIFTYNLTTKSLQQLKQFGPEWGTSDLDVRDYDNNGFYDILIANGDNADYSIVAKEYHGIRIYESEEQGLQEKFFLPIYGATQAQFIDLDGSYPLEIIISSFFPETISHGITLVKFREDLKDYQVYHFEKAPQGRWLAMKVEDVDGDGDEDAILSSFRYGPTTVDAETMKTWDGYAADVLYLENKR